MTEPCPYDPTESPEAAAAAATWLARQRRMADGWHGRGWADPAARLRELDERYEAPAEARTMSGADALAHLDRMDELGRHALDGELLDVYERATGCGSVRHSRGWPS